MVQFSTNDESSGAPSARLGPSFDEGISHDGRTASFTIESANQMLPLVGRIASDLVMLSRDLAQQDPQIRGIERLPSPTKLPAFVDELNAIKESFNTERQRLESCHRELLSLGLRIDSLELGIFDFPAMMDLRPVLLCWQIGEPTVAHWHDWTENHQHRRPIEDQPFDKVSSSATAL